MNMGYNVDEALIKGESLIKEVIREVSHRIDNYMATAYIDKSVHSDFHYGLPIYKTKNNSWEFSFTFDKNYAYVTDVISTKFIKTKQFCSKQYNSSIITENIVAKSYLTKSYLHRIIVENINKLFPKRKPLK
jgi:hypothetical protein